MIETTNNIIFWIGYLTIISVFLFIISFCFYGIVQNILKLPNLFITIFNKQFNNRIENMNEEQINKWLKEQKAKWDRKHKK